MTNQLLPFAARLSVHTACLLLLGSSVVFAKNKAPQAPAKADTEKAGMPFQHRGVASANPLASAAGLQILKAGGSAVDAAIAVQLVLTLVEPQSSGIGGGAFLVHDDGKQLQVFDGRETAPLLAPSDIFMLNGKALSFNDVVAGGRAVGVPGLLRMMALAHKQHGKLPWAALFKPAIKIAETGFPISARLHALLKAEPTLLKDPQSVAYFFKPNGTPLPVGHRLTNPGLAKVYKLIAKDGADAFYTGALAQTIVNRVQQYANNPGLLTMADMSKYRPEVREAMCFSNSGTQSDGKTMHICGAGAPSSGLIAMGQIFGMLSAQARPVNDMQSVDWLHNYNEAARLAFAVSSGFDSRTILDAQGAERLIGQGDALFHQPGLPKPVRLQVPYVSEEEVARVAGFLRGQSYEDRFAEAYGADFEPPKAVEGGGPGEVDFSDPLLKKAAEIVVEEGYGSVSRLQRRLSIGHARAGKLMDALEAMGIVGPPRGSKPREVLVTKDQLKDFFG